MKKITVIGLGYADLSSITLGAYRKLTTAKHVFLRTIDHPIVEELQAEGVQFTSFDSVYEDKNQFAEVYETIVERLIEQLTSHDEVIYAVPGHPLVAEKTVQLLLEKQEQQGFEVVVEGSPSFLDIAFARLGFDPIEGFALLDGTAMEVDQVDPSIHLIIGQVFDRFIASDVKLTLMEIFPDEQEIWILEALGVPGKEQIRKVPLYELDRQEVFSNLTALYIPPATQREPLYRKFDYLVKIIATLRGPNGCPWDRKQTHQSLRPYLLEETYEFLEALDQGDFEAMTEELGDVLLQILLHSQIAKDEGNFSILDVIGTLSEKMIRRHPHVFRSESIATAENVVKKWDEIKREEKGGKAPSSLLDGIPKSMSPLAKAYEQNKQAAKVGFDWETAEDIWKKLEEEIKEFREAVLVEEKEKELGDILFTIASISRYFHLHPELALQKAVQKFERRFRYLEEKASALGRSLSEATVQEMNQWWDEAKSKEL